MGHKTVKNTEHKKKKRADQVTPRYTKTFDVRHYSV